MNATNMLSWAILNLFLGHVLLWLYQIILCVLQLPLKGLSQCIEGILINILYQMKTLFIVLVSISMFKSETDVHQQKGFTLRFVITFIQFDYKRVQHSKNSSSFVKIESDINPSLFSKQITKPFLLIYFLSDQCLKPHNTRW